MTEGWILWSIFIAIFIFTVVFVPINMHYPKWRKEKYILPGIILLIGAVFVSVAVLIFMDIMILIVGVVLLVIAVIGGLIGLIVDFFSRHR